MAESDIDWYGPDMATFGDRLVAAREAANMSQPELARRLGVRTRTLASWEDDLSEPRANKLSMVAGMLNVSMIWLMTGQGEGTAAPDVERGPVNLSEILGELRSLRQDLRIQAERAGRLEKRLRELVPQDWA